MLRSITLPLFAAILFVPASIDAQNITVPAPQPGATPTASPAPLPTVVAPPLTAPITIPSPIGAPTPLRTIVPTARRTPTPAARPSSHPTPPRARVVHARASLTPVKAQSVRAAPTPRATPTPTTTLTRAPPPPIETVVLPQRQPDRPLWPWLAGAGGVALFGLGWVALRRRGERRDEEPWIEPVVEPAAAPAPAARLVLALRPTRAGLNLISVTVDAEVTLTNTGDVPAEDVRAELRLMSAHGEQDAELAAFYAEAVLRPATPPFTLQPGEERRFRAITALAHSAVRAIEAGGRPMFVPLVALSVRYRDAAVERRTGQAYAVGVERVDSAKLAPFWLDVPAKSYDSIAARPHGGPQDL